MEVNERGNEIYRNEDADSKLGLVLGLPPHKCHPSRWTDDDERYFYDFGILSSWTQYDTWQDASYFGVWVHIQNRMTFTYCEGDRTLVICPILDGFKAELANAAEFYGPPPAACTCIGMDGTVEKIYDTRPTGDPDQQFEPPAIQRALANG